MARRERRDESGENDAHSIEIKFTLFIYIHRTNDFRNDDCAKAIVSNAKETAQLFVNYWMTLRHVSTCGQSRRLVNAIQSPSCRALAIRRRYWPIEKMRVLQRYQAELSIFDTAKASPLCVPQPLHRQCVPGLISRGHNGNFC
jgi:hypothetical protein